MANFWQGCKGVFLDPQDFILQQQKREELKLEKVRISLFSSIIIFKPYHTAYSWNIMCQKWEGDCGLWFPNEIILKKYAESLKKIMGAVWELPAK